MTCKRFVLGGLIASALSSGMAARAISPDQVHEAIRSVGGVELFLKKMAGDSAANFPQRIDREFEAVGVVLVGRTLTYTHRTPQHLRADIRDIADTRKRMLANTSKRLCTSPIAGTLITEYDVEYRYTVLARDNTYVTEYEITKKTCAPFIGGAKK